MSDYNRLLNISNKSIEPLKNELYLMQFRFSIKLHNGEPFYLSNFFIKQVLNSEAIQKYLIKEIDSFIFENYNDVILKNKKSLCLNNIPNVNMKALGKYFYISIGYYKNFDVKVLNRYIKKYFKTFFN